ncbi:MAG: sensor histidine kinase [Sulfobacillus sp.]
MTLKSLRTRLTVQTIAAIVSLVVFLTGVTLVAVTIHLYDASLSDAFTVYDGISDIGGATQHALLHAYDRVLDPHIWIIKNHRIVARSPNTRHETPTLSQWAPVPLVFHPLAALQLSRNKGELHYIVDWPISPELDIMGDLVIVLGIVTLVSAVVGVLLGRWITRRVLEPVQRMTSSVQEMITQGKYHPVNNPSPQTGDEFSQLSRVFSQLITILNERWERDRTLLAEAAHQLRTPLEVIRGNLDILSQWEVVDPAVEQDSLSAMDRAVSDMTHLVRDLLTLEQVGRRLPIQLDAILLIPLLEDILEDARAIKPDVPITLLNPANGNILVWANEDYTRRVLWAITENAVKYGAHKDFPVTLTVTPMGEKIHVEIADHGPGIASQDLPHLFDRFYRGQSAKGQPGTGLGLSIALALMTSQQGHLTLNSSSTGTTVTLVFQNATMISVSRP